jgi:hypothetical protein
VNRRRCLGGETGKFNHGGAGTDRTQLPVTPRRTRREPGTSARRATIARDAAAGDDSRYAQRHARRCEATEVLPAACSSQPTPT